MTLSPKLGVVEISTLWNFRLPLPIQMFIKVVSSPRLSGIGMPSPMLWSHPLKMQRIVLLSSLLWWELGTNSLITGPGEWLSFRRFTSKLSTDPQKSVNKNCRACEMWHRNCSRVNAACSRPEVSLLWELENVICRHGFCRGTEFKHYSMQMTSAFTVANSILRKGPHDSSKPMKRRSTAHLHIMKLTRANSTTEHGENLISKAKNGKIISDHNALFEEDINCKSLLARARKRICGYSFVCIVQLGL